MSHSRYVRTHWPARQGGAALVVGLILLVVITLVGVAAMQGTTLQEKMAGNLRDSNLSFQASEAVLRTCENILQQDYALQVSLFGPPPPNSPVVNNPPRPPLLDQDWPLGGRTPLPAWLLPLLPPGMPATIWLWSLDNGQAGALFPGLAGNRLDPAAGNPPWWVESARGGAWWDGAPSNSQQLPANNTLDGLFSQPRCILEGYIYVLADNSTEAQAFRRSIPTDGLVIKNENQFRRERHYFRNTARGVGGSENAVSMLQTGVYMNYYVPN